MKHIVVLAGLSVLGLGWAGQGQKAPKVPFASSVGMVIKGHCLNCHQGQNIAGGLDLSDPARIKASGTVVPGKPEKSELWRRIKGLDGKPAMPMGYKPLSAEKIKLVEDWIRAGASYDSGSLKHWSYVAPVRPAVPAGKNPIDFFVRQRLTQLGMKPSAPAATETLVRRLYLDLIGLPPTPEQIDSFLADKSPSAYEKLVDKLLASKHYGERQARTWLDLARYADTNGYEADFSRPSAWVYRDWVISAFNANMPFDQFTRDQLAGDMLPNATQDQKVATGFHRNSMFNSEGGVDPGESRYLTMVDRVATTSTVWLGSTVGCARCHDHKFDPITQKDFTRLYAIFDNTTYRRDGDAKVGQEKWYEPTMPVTTSDIEKRLNAANQELTRSEAALAAASVDDAVFREFRDALGSSSQPLDLKPTQAVATGGTPLTIQDDGSVKASGNPDRENITITAPVDGSTVHGLRLKVISNGKTVSLNDGNILLTGIEVLADGKAVNLSHAEADFTQSGYDLDRLLAQDIDNGWAVYPRANENRHLIVDFAEGLKPKELKITLKFQSRTWVKHVPRHIQLSAMLNRFPSMAFAPEPIVHSVRKRSASTEEEMKAVRELFVRVSPTTRPLYLAVQQAKRTRDSISGERPEALVLVEKPTSGTIKAPLYTRGEFLSPSDPVEAGVPNSLPALPKNARANRLSLATWLTSKSNPLTARVQVNRLWEQYFGRGLVETSEDFGTQGAPPSHPKLLDWLASEFMDSGWNLKHMHKLIVMSATYRQSSATTPSLLKKDPYNVLLARGPRFRMEAEMIRDTSLTASGLLNPAIGGPSVMPYQPDGVWDSPYSGERWMEMNDARRYRRGLYVFWKRASVYPSFMALDATSREICTSRRIRTNTPLQALTLLNDKANLEAAKALGDKMKAKGIPYGFRCATGRRPSASELKVLNQAHVTFKKRYTGLPEEAKKLGGVETAAWTLVGNVLLNLDETMTKG